MQKEPMTPGGLEILKAELKDLKTVQRPKNVADIEEARAHGDLKENSEYHAAKEKQGHIAGRIEMIEDAIARAEVIDPAKLNTEKIAFGAKIKLLDEDNDSEIEYSLVGKFESDLKQGKISYLAPLSKLLIGKEEGDSITFKSPKGEKNYEVLEISYG